VELGVQLTQNPPHGSEWDFGLWLEWLWACMENLKFNRWQLI